MKYHVEVYLLQDDGRADDCVLHEEEIVMEQGFLPNAGDSIQLDPKKPDVYKVVSRHFGFCGGGTWTVELNVVPLTRDELLARVSEA